MHVCIENFSALEIRQDGGEELLVIDDDKYSSLLEQLSLPSISPCLVKFNHRRAGFSPFQLNSFVFLFAKRFRATIKVFWVLLCHSKLNVRQGMQNIKIKYLRDRFDSSKKFFV